MPNDGGPVYPHHTAIPDGQGGWHMLDEWGFREPGMSLRQLYAGLAMQAILTNTTLVLSFNSSDVALITRRAFAQAEDMIAHEDKSKEDNSETDDKH